MMTMATAAIVTASKQDELRVIMTVARAFQDDPAVRWLYPEARQYTTHFPNFVRAFGGKAFAHQSAHVVDGFEGAALWLPPGIEPDGDELGSLLDRTAAPGILGDVMSMFEQMGRHHPSEPHWYLPLIGVDPRFHGQGLGSALLRHALADCDRERIPAYLESSNPRNISLYRRHGFEITGVIQAGSSPTIYPMVREPLPTVRLSDN